MFSSLDIVFIEVYLIYKVVLVSSVWQSDSTIYMYTHIHRPWSCKESDTTDTVCMLARTHTYTHTHTHTHNHNGMIIHLEPDILQSEVKWTLGSTTTNKASGGDGIPAELFQILKDEAVKCYTQYASKFGKLSSGHKTGKGQFSFQSPRKAMPRNVQTTTKLHSSPILAK